MLAHRGMLKGEERDDIISRTLGVSVVYTRMHTHTHAHTHITMHTHALTCACQCSPRIKYVEVYQSTWATAVYT